jgi:tetrahydromethanopterin S-methyltransferase subunit C
MKNFHRTLNIALIGGVVGIGIMTWLGPKMIGLVLTPPVSFGVNCEPAAAYSMQKLIIAQIVGLVVGALLTLLIRYKLFGGKRNPYEPVK